MATIIRIPAEADEDAGALELLAAAERPPHAVQLYDDTAALFESVGRFLGEGLERGEHVVVIATPAHRDGITRCIDSITLGRALARRRLTILDARDTLDTFMVDGAVDPDRFRVALDTIIGAVRAEAPDARIRAFGEMVDVLWRAGSSNTALRLEELWGEARARHSFTLLCAYVMESLSDEHAAGFGDVYARHTHVLTDGAASLRSLTPPDGGAPLDAGSATRAGASHATRVSVPPSSGYATRVSVPPSSGYATRVSVPPSSGYATRAAPASAAPATRAGGQPSSGYAMRAVHPPGAATRAAPPPAAGSSTRVIALPNAGVATRAVSPAAALSTRAGAGSANGALEDRMRSLETELRHRRGLEVALREALRERGRVEAELRESVSRERAARATAEENDRFKEQFLAILGHDLRNPLNTILTTARLMILRGELAQESARRLERVITSGVRMQRMIEQILDVTCDRLSGGVPIAREPAQDVAAVVSKVIEDALQTHPTARVEQQVDGPCTAAVDSERLGQVLRTLVGNAIVHGASDSPVRVRIVARADAVRIEVHNGGPPIDPADRALLFEPFKRSRKSKGPSEGLGLGLYIAERIVRAHDGALEVESSAEGGTLFRITLPRFP